jgi:hypothetical protein
VNVGNAPECLEPASGVYGNQQRRSTRRSGRSVGQRAHYAPAPDHVLLIERCAHVTAMCRRCLCTLIQRRLRCQQQAPTAKGVLRSYRRGGVATLTAA